MGSALQYDSRDAVLGGLRRDYNLADYPAQENDLPVKLTVQPVVNIKDSVTIRCSLVKEFLIAPIGAFTEFFLLQDPKSGNPYKNWNISIKNITCFGAATGNLTAGLMATGAEGTSSNIYIATELKKLVNNLSVSIGILDINYDTVNFKQSLFVGHSAISMFIMGTTDAINQTFFVTYDVEMRPGRSQSIPSQD